MPAQSELLSGILSPKFNPKDRLARKMILRNVPLKRHSSSSTGTSVKQTKHLGSELNGALQMSLHKASWVTVRVVGMEFAGATSHAINLVGSPRLTLQRSCRGENNYIVDGFSRCENRRCVFSQFPVPLAHLRPCLYHVYRST